MASVCLIPVRPLLCNCWTDLCGSLTKVANDRCSRGTILGLSNLCIGGPHPVDISYIEQWTNIVHLRMHLTFLTTMTFSRYPMFNGFDACPQSCGTPLHFFFRADRKTKMATPASVWLRHFWLLLWNRWTEFNDRKLTGRKISRSSTKFVFFGLIGKPRWPTSLWLAERYSTSHLKPLNRIHCNLTGSKISPSSTKFVFQTDRKNKMAAARSLIGWEMFDFSSETTGRNSTKLDRKQDLNVLNQVCAFRADRKTKSDTTASDWLRHFPLLLNCLNGIQRNLTRSKISTSSAKNFVFFRTNRKPWWPPWPIHKKGGTLYLGARYVSLWASCYHGIIGSGVVS